MWPTTILDFFDCSRTSENEEENSRMLSFPFAGEIL
jgi:hypothetical protein